MLGSRDVVVGSIGAALLVSAFWRSDRNVVTEVTTQTPDSATWERTLLTAHDSLVRLGTDLGTGNGSADWVIAFNDYSCEYCDKLSRSLDTVAARSSQLRITVIPLASFLPQAVDSANLAVICAASIGRLAELHRSLVLRDSSAGSAAERTERMNDDIQVCVRSDAAAEKLQTIRAYARRLMVPGVPFLVGASGRVHLGAASADEIERLARTRPPHDK